MSLPATTLRIDTSGTAFGAAPTWTDYTSSLLTGADGEPIAITWGAQDEDSDPQPRTCSFVLDNASGAWTPGNAGAPAQWDIGCPVNVRVTVGGTTYDRFTGYVDTIEPAWPGGSTAWSVVRVTCTDVSARLGVANPLRHLFAQVVIDAPPTFLFPLWESGPVTTVGDPRTGSTAQLVAAQNGTKATFDSSLSGLLDTITGCEFGAWSSGTAAACTAFNAGMTSIKALGANTLECLFQISTAPGGSAYMLILNNQPGDSTCMALYMDGSGRVNFLVTGASGLQTNTVTSTGSFADGQAHHAVGVLGTDFQTLTLYVDGVQVATSASTAFSLNGSVVDACIGGWIRSLDGQGSGQFPGTIAYAAFYKGIAMSAATVLAHYQAAVGTGPTESTDARFARLAGYGGLTTAGLPAGATTMTGQKTAGKSVLEGLQTVARTEGSAAYVTGDGALTFASRSARYHAAVGLTLTASNTSADLNVRRDRQGLANEVTVSRSGGATQVVKDSTSQADYGRFDGGSFEVAPSTDDDAFNNGSWFVATHKNPRTRLASLPVDLLVEGTTATAQAVLAATIGTKVQITGMPSQAPSSTFTGFIEGATERIGVDEWSIEFFTSPVTLEDSVWVLEDATYGAIDSTNVIAF